MAATARTPTTTAPVAARKKPLAPLPFKFLVLLFGFTTLLRVLIGFHPHSGQNNYHGSKTGYGGDFEAQRHWMELTFHLPIGDWYWYDLEYWGLDYPPLTAYQSFLCGIGSHYLVGAESVAFEISRGIEDPVHKAYMRATVLVLDLLIFGTAVWYSTFSRDRKSVWAILITLCQPAILLIDHGHFQYNTVALGLAIWSFSYMVQPEFTGCILGSIFFCLALNFKQMTLYYAPPVFCYLLGRCFAVPKLFLIRFSLLAATVIVTFGILWEPFLKYGPSDMETDVWQRSLHILRRIFPLERGLFEGKVANLWCALSTKPVNIRDRIPSDLQPIFALAATLVMILPSCVQSFRLGIANIHETKRHWIQLLWATTSSALAFFLASFQVHEKSILLALAPCSLLLWQDPIFVDWFSLASVWSLWPLLQIDRLQVAYACSTAVFGSLIWFRRMGQGKITTPSSFAGLTKWIPSFSYIGMMGTHLAQVFVPVPLTLPDLFDVAWSVAGCGMFSIAWLITCAKLFGSSFPVPAVPTMDRSKLKTS